MKTHLARMVSKDIHNLREKLSLSLIDMHFLTGSMTRKWSTQSIDEINDPSLSIMVRYLLKHPEDNFVPKLPDIHAVSEMIDSAWIDNDYQYNVRRIGTMFGCTEMAGYNWGAHTEPSQLVNHLMILVVNAIKKEGRAGLQKYLNIIKEEALSRGIKDMHDLWIGGWKAHAKNYRETTSQENRMRSRDFSNLREMLNLSLIDLHWLTGSMTRKWTNTGTDIIVDPTFSLMVRYLTKYPEALIVPRPPELDAVISQIDMAWDDHEYAFNTRRIGTMFGCTEIAGYSWGSSTIPSQLIRHLMMIVSNAINKDGKYGLNKYLAIVKEEAVSRGISTDRDLWVGGWKTYKRLETDDPSELLLPKAKRRGRPSVSSV